MERASNSPGWLAHRVRGICHCPQVDMLIDEMRVVHVDVTVAVVCLLHHAHAAAARGAELTHDACVELADAAMRSVRDIVRWNAANR